MDSETQLQIVISAVNNAQAALDEVSEQLQTLGTQASDTASVMTDSMQNAGTAITNALTPAEEAAAEAAVATAAQWSDSMDTIPGYTQEAADAIQTAWLGISESAGTSAAAASGAWDTSLADLQATMSQTSEAVDGQFAAMEDAAGASAAGMGGTFGYFHNLILGLMAERAGSALTGFTQDVVNAATAGDATEKVQQLTAEIQQQQAAIQTHEAALQNWSGTTVEVNARHQAASAAIEAETVKIQQLQLQLTPLQSAQKDGAQAAQAYATATAQLDTDWQSFLATLADSGFIQTLTQGVQQIDNLVKAMQGWAAENPQLAQELMTFISVLGPLLTALGFIAIAFAMVMLACTAAAGPFLLVGAALAVVIAAVVALWPQITQLFDEINEHTGLVTALQNAWESIVTTFDSKLLPALEKLWVALQPLEPSLQLLAQIVGVTIVAAILLLINALTTAITMFEQILTIATEVETFFIDKLVVAINSVESALTKLFSSSAFQELTKIGSSLGGFVSSVGSVLGGAIPAFASGGIVNGPTLALVGEAGPEAIIPLSAFSGGNSLGGGVGGGGPSGNINIYIQGGNYLNQGGAQQIASALATMVGRQLKLTTV